MAELKPILLVDCHNGIHIPRIFAQTYNYAENFKNYSEIEADLNDLSKANSIDSEDYFETFDIIMHTAILLIDGNEYYIYQNDDLWAMPVGYENEEF